MRDGERVLWEPNEPVGDFRFLADDPMPAKTNTKRLVQMRAMAREFTAFDDFKIHHEDKDTTRHELRLMTNPLYRYEDLDHGIIDGTVFAYCLGTDPEVFVVIEARQDSDGGSSWEYALSPMTCWAVEVKHKGKSIWSIPERFGKHSPQDGYHVWVFDKK